MWDIFVVFEVSRRIYSLSLKERRGYRYSFENKLLRGGIWR